MALLNNGIFGNVSGKIGNVQGSHWRGRDTIQGWNQRLNVVATQPQLNNQTKMGWCRYYAKGWKSLIEYMLVSRLNAKIGAWASFIKLNFKCVYFGGGLFSYNIYFGKPILATARVSYSAFPISVYKITTDFSYYDFGGLDPSLFECTFFWFNQTRNYTKWANAWYPVPCFFIDLIDNDLVLNDFVAMWALVHQKGTQNISKTSITFIFAGS